MGVSQLPPKVMNIIDRVRVPKVHQYPIILSKLLFSAMDKLGYTPLLKQTNEIELSFY